MSTPVPSCDSTPPPNDLPGELTVSSDQSATLTGTAVDRHGNPRNDPITWSASASNVTVTQHGVVMTSHYGIHTITARAGTRNGSAVIALLPQGRITALLNGNIIAVNLDGTNLQTLVTNVPDGGIGIHPRWIPHTNTVVFTTYNGTVQVLETVNGSGGGNSLPLHFSVRFPRGRALSERRRHVDVLQCLQHAMRHGGLLPLSCGARRIAPGIIGQLHPTWRRQPGVYVGPFEERVCYQISVSISESVAR